jgi:hypothetical protein
MTHAMPMFVESAVSPDWTTDPAQLNFIDYRDRQLWGPPDQAGKGQCINLALVRKPFSNLGTGTRNGIAARLHSKQ